MSFFWLCIILGISLTVLEVMDEYIVLDLSGEVIIFIILYVTLSKV
jgi:hypothetical protein